MGPLCSLYVLERLLLAVTDQPFLSTILTALLGGPAAGAMPPLSPITSCSTLAGLRPSSPAAGSMPKASQPSNSSRPSSPAAASPKPTPTGDQASSKRRPAAAIELPAVATAAAAGAEPAGPAALEGGALPLPAGLLVRLQYSPAAYRGVFLGMLRGPDAQLAAAAVRVLAALVRSRAVGEGLLELLGEWSWPPFLGQTGAPKGGRVCPTDA